MRKRFVKCKTDVVFKKLFTENLDILQGFLADIFGVPYESIKNIKVENSENVPDRVDGKFSRFDLKLTVDDVLVNVEIQILNYGDFPERIVLYWSQRYSRQLKKGEEYSTLKKTVSINIVNFNLFKKDGYVSEYALMDVETGHILTDKLGIYFFELPKVRKAAETNTDDRKREWMQIIDAESEEELDMLAQKVQTEPLKKAVYTIKHYNADEEFRMLAEAREEQLRSEKSAMSFWTNEGIKRGIEQGIDKGRKEGRVEGRAEGLKEGLSKGIDKGRNETMYSVILAMKKNGLDAEQIARLTGFNADDVRASYDTVK